MLLTKCKSLFDKDLGEPDYAHFQDVPVFWDQLYAERLYEAEVLAPPEQIDYIISELSRLLFLEIVRSGAVAI